MIKITCERSERELRSQLRGLIFQRGRTQCVQCGSYRVRTLERRYWCRRCRKKFSLTSGTWLRSMKIPLKTFFILLDSWINEVPLKEAMRRSGTSYVTVHSWYKKFREHIPKTLAFKPHVAVQVDEAYFGRFKRQANYYHGFRKYKVVNKVGVVGVACPTTGQLATRIIQGTPGVFVKAFIRELVPTNVHVYADGSYLYTRLSETHFLTQRTHDQGFHFAYYIESCWSWMKRLLFKMYHHFTRTYATQYIAELTWRFNIRNSSKNPFSLLRNSF